MTVTSPWASIPYSIATDEIIGPQAYVSARSSKKSCTSLAFSVVTTNLLSSSSACFAFVKSRRSLEPSAVDGSMLTAYELETLKFGIAAAAAAAVEDLVPLIARKKIEELFAGSRDRRDAGLVPLLVVTLA